MDLRDKVCVVTGASSGIGRTTALELASEGARVCVTARREELLSALVDEMGGEQLGHSHMVTDVADRAQVAALAAFVRERYQRCDVLVNNAGFSMGHDRFEGPADIEDVAAIMATNFYGTVYCTGELLPLLLESAPSNVVNVASVAGRLAAAGASAYCASKFAVVGWSEALHFDLIDKGVCVSLVEPGFVPTEGFPQTGLIDHPVFKYAMGSTEGVSAAILDAIKKRKLERVTPRWYYALQVPRLLSPPLYRLVQEKVVKKVSW